LPTILKLGLTKKIGQPDYGSLAASCHVEVELDSALLHGDLDGFHRHVRSAFVACRQAVNDELARCQSTGAEGNGHARNGSPSNGHTHGRSTRQPAQARSTARRATASQVRAIQAICDREGFDLPAILREQFQVTSAGELSITQASQLIDQLKGAAQQGGGP
jgi:hypothetical protein